MTNQNDLALQLYKANLEFYLRLGRLLQENSKRWMELGTRMLGDSIAEFSAEVEQLLKSQDWQALATLPGEIFWRQLQQRMGDDQTMAQLALNAQTAFARGLQDALKHWQEATAQAFGGIYDADTLRANFGDFLKPWKDLTAAAASAASSMQNNPSTGGARGEGK